MPRELEKRAVDIVNEYEIKNGRTPVDFSSKGVGYDIQSNNQTSQRYIEVKGISESWSTYSWQPLYYSEVECLKNNPDKFFLYIVYFANDSYDLYILPGQELLSENFRIRPMTFALTPISRRRLSSYKKVI